MKNTNVNAIIVSTLLFVVSVLLPAYSVSARERSSSDGFSRGGSVSSRVSVYNYTEMSRSGDPGWKRSVVVEDINETLKFKVTIRNYSNATLKEFNVKELLPEALYFTNSKVVVRDVRQQDVTESTYNSSDLVSGITLEELNPWSSTAHYYEVIFETKALPDTCGVPQKYENEFLVTYEDNRALDRASFGLSLDCK